MHQRDRGNRYAWSLAGGHYFRFEFIRVSPPFAATQGGILINSVHLSTYSLVDTMLPRLLRRFKMPSPGAYGLASCWTLLCSGFDSVVFSAFLPVWQGAA
jgi:hypothetical protein